MSTPKTFDDLPLTQTPLSLEEAAKWINVIDPLLKYAGSPGDWGYKSKLGILTQRLYEVRAQIVAAHEGSTGGLSDD